MLLSEVSSKLPKAVDHVTNEVMGEVQRLSKKQLDKWKELLWRVKTEVKGQAVVTITLNREIASDSRMPEKTKNEQFSDLHDCYEELEEFLGGYDISPVEVSTWANGTFYTIDIRMRGHEAE